MLLDREDIGAIEQRLIDVGIISAYALDKLGQNGVLYHGLEVLGGGAVLTGVIWASVTAFVIDRDFPKAAAFALAGAVLTFFGLMHGEAVGIGQSPMVAFSYLLGAYIDVVLLLLWWIAAKLMQDPEVLPGPAAIVVQRMTQV